MSVITVEESVQLKNTFNLPQKICNNPRQKIEGKQVDPNTLIPTSHTEKEISTIEVGPLPITECQQPCPRYPLVITWSPDSLYFELNEEPVILKLWIWNSCTHLIYIHCCGLQDSSARLGASWRTYPHTRFHLAPGLKSELYVKAIPRSMTPVSHAFVNLQLAASHMRDTVTGYFAVPVTAKFLKYIPPPSLDEEE